MAITVIDSTNTEAILADAGVTLDKPADSNEVKEVDKVESKQSDAEIDKNEIDPDDIEGEDGLTPREKRDLSNKMQKAVSKRHRQMKEAEEFAAAQYNERRLAEQKIAELEAKLANFKPVEPEQEKKLSKPQRENFVTDSEYIDAMIQYGVDQRLQEKAEEDKKQAAQRAQEQIIEAAKSRIEKAIELIPDYEDVVGDSDIVVPPAIAGYMQKSELFAELGYHLAKNPDILMALSKMAPDEQLVKIGKIEGNLKPFGAEKQDKSNDSDGATPRKSDDSKVESSNLTELNPSKARNNAPVINPINGTGAAGLKHTDLDIRSEISAYAKSKQVNFSLRKRH